MSASKAEIQAGIARLQQAAIEALSEGDFKAGSELGRAAVALAEWLAAGMADALPVDIDAEALAEWLAEGMPGEVPLDLDALLGKKPSVTAAELTVEEMRRRIDTLREPLRAARKDIGEVEEARLEVWQLLHEGLISDPDLYRQLEQVFEQLNALRDDILRASRGVSASERARNFEQAIQLYEDALYAGYDFIVDEVTGERINVSEALERARQAYWDDLMERAGSRHQEAQQSLADGYPETAVCKLEEAQKLVHKIEEGGEEIRRQVEDALVRAREELRSKREAQELVAKAEAATHREEEIQAQIDLLQQTAIEAIQQGDFKSGAELGQAAQELTAWLVEGMTGEVPLDLDVLLGKEPSVTAAELTVEEIHRRIDVLRAPLRAPRKDIGKVEEARLEAQQLLQEDLISDPHLNRQIEQILEQLNTLRDDILRISKDGAGSERARNFEQAIKIYEGALYAGYDYILDDIGGKRINVREALDRARQDHRDVLMERAGSRLQEAQQSLADGQPKMVVQKLEEAQGLVSKIGGGSKGTTAGPGIGRIGSWRDLPRIVWILGALGVMIALLMGCLSGTYAGMMLSRRPTATPVPAASTTTPSPPTVAPIRPTQPPPTTALPPRIQSVTIQMEKPTVPTGQSIFFTMTYEPEEAPAPTRYVWNFGDGAPPNNEPNPAHTYTEAGTYNVSVTVTGAREEKVETTTTVIVTPAPIEGLTIEGDTVVEAFTSTTFTATVTAGKIVTYTWEFGDGTPLSTEANPTHTYTAADTYTVTLAADSVVNTLIATYRVDVEEPILYLNTEHSGPTQWGLPTTFTATAGVDEAAFNWDFGDGQTAEGQVVSHTFSTTGTQTVAVTACNAVSEIRDSSRVKVSKCRFSARWEGNDPDDNLTFFPGETFTITYRCLNTGDCVWRPEDVKIVWITDTVTGKPLDPPIELALTKRVEPGEIGEFVGAITAPTEAGNYDYEGPMQLYWPDGTFALANHRPRFAFSVR